MTQVSYFWDGSAVGDAVYAPYDAATEFSRVLISLAAAGAIPTNFGGVFRDELGEFVTTGASSPISVATGRALCYGSWLESDAPESVVIATPVGATRIDMLVVSKDWSAKVTRLKLVPGTPGGGAPALVQTLGVEWQIPLYQVSITTGGVITVTSAREFIPRFTHNHTGGADDAPLIVLQSIPYHCFTANAEGRGKFEDGFITPNLIQGAWTTSCVSTWADAVSADFTWVDLLSTTLVLTFAGKINAWGHSRILTSVFPAECALRIKIGTDEGTYMVYTVSSTMGYDASAMHSAVIAAPGTITITLQGRYESGAGGATIHFGAKQLMAQSQA